MAISPNDKLRMRIVLLEDALRFYANERHWGEDDWGVHAVVSPPEYGNPGEIARHALKNHMHVVRALLEEANSINNS